MSRPAEIPARLWAATPAPDPKVARLPRRKAKAPPVPGRVEGLAAERALLTPAQIADRLQVGKRQVERWMASGALTFVDLGARTRRVSEAQYAQFLAARAR